jgi:hypothetical protein
MQHPPTESDGLHVAEAVLNQLYIKKSKKIPLLMFKKTLFRKWIKVFSLGKSLLSN